MWWIGSLLGCGEPPPSREAPPAAIVSVVESVEPTVPPVELSQATRPTLQLEAWWSANEHQQIHSFAAGESEQGSLVFVEMTSETTQSIRKLFSPHDLDIPTRKVVRYSEDRNSKWSVRKQSWTTSNFTRSCLVIENSTNAQVRCAVQATDGSISAIALVGEQIWFSGRGTLQGVWRFTIPTNQLEQWDETATNFVPLSEEAVAVSDNDQIRLLRKQINPLQPLSKLDPALLSPWGRITTDFDGPVIRSSCGEPWNGFRFEENNLHGRIDDIEYAAPIAGYQKIGDRIAIFAKAADGRPLLALELQPTESGIFQVTFRLNGAPFQTVELIPIDSGVIPIIDDCG